MGNSLTISVTVPSEELRRIMAEVQGTDLARDLKRAVRDATSDAVPTVRRAIMSQPSSSDHKGKASLRRAVAMAVKRTVKLSKTKAEVSVAWVPQGGLSNLGRVLEGVIPWKHPTYGHRPEVTQSPHPFFYVHLNRIAENVQRRIMQVAAEYERKLR